MTYSVSSPFHSYSLKLGAHFSCHEIWRHPSALRLPTYSSAYQRAFLLRDVLIELVLVFCFQTSLPHYTLTKSSITYSV